MVFLYIVFIYEQRKSYLLLKMLALKYIGFIASEVRFRSLCRYLLGGRDVRICEDARL